ncbi:MAG: hypothetical protein ACOC80_14260 [Petrotogales bacterium]
MYDPIITITNTAICEACDKLEKYFASKYGVKADEPQDAIAQLENLPLGSEPKDDDYERLQYWKALVRIVMDETPTYLLAF